MSATNMLLVPADVNTELRLALLANLRSLAEDFLSVISENERALHSTSTNGGEPHRRHFREALRAIEVRQQLQETIGWPGLPPSEQTLTGEAHCDLAVAVLTEYRETQVARLAHGAVPEQEREGMTARVKLLTGYLRYARIAPRNGVLEIKDPRLFPAR